MAGDQPDIAAMFNRGQLGGGGGGGAAASKGPDDGAGTKESPEIALEGAGGIAGKIGATFLGVDLTNAGSASMLQGLESEGFASKTPPGLIPDAQGGVLYKILSALIKDGTLKDHTGGVGGSAEGGGMEIAAGHHGGGDGHFDPASYLPVAGQRFDVADVPEMPVGGFRPSSSPGAGQGAGEALSA